MNIFYQPNCTDVLKQDAVILLINGINEINGAFIMFLNVCTSLCMFKNKMWTGKGYSLVNKRDANTYFSKPNSYI